MLTDAQREARKLAKDLRELARFIEKRGHLLPYLPTIHQTYYLTSNKYEYKVDENGERILDEQGNPQWESTVNKEETARLTAAFLDAVQDCEKEYDTGSVRIIKKFGDITIRGSLSKEATCKKVVKGRKLVPSYHVPEHWEDDVEYVCDDDISLLKFTKENVPTT